jgi:hypothetical protein
MNEGENVMLDFVELDNGTIADGITAKLIRDELRSIYNELRKKDLLSRTWGSIGITARNFIFKHLYAKYPYLLLCHNDWKVIAIAGPVLSQWWNAENKRLSRRDGAAVKIEQDLKPAVVDGEVVVNVNKRKAPDSPDDDEPVMKQSRSSRSPVRVPVMPLGHVLLLSTPALPLDPPPTNTRVSDSTGKPLSLFPWHSHHLLAASATSSVCQHKPSEIVAMGKLTVFFL